MIATLLGRLAPYKTIFELVIFGGLLFFAATAWHNHEQGVEDRGAAKQKAIDEAAVSEARKQALAWQGLYNTQVEAANKDRKDRDETITKAAAATAAAADRVQNSSRGLAAAAAALSPDALRDAAGAFRQVSVECAGRAGRLGERLDSMAKTAERLNAEKAQLMASWPKPANMQPVPQPTH